jgi:hypothetical protein
VGVNKYPARGYPTPNPPRKGEGKRNHKRQTSPTGKSPVPPLRVASRRWRCRISRTAGGRICFAGTLGLNRRAWHGAVGAEHATVALLRSQLGAATGAHIEKLAGIRWHRLSLRGGAMRTGNNGLEKHDAWLPAADGNLAFVVPDAHFTDQLMVREPSFVVPANAAIRRVFSVEQWGNLFSPRSCGEGVSRHRACGYPTPDPSPQGGGKKTQFPIFGNKLDADPKSPDYPRIPFHQKGRLAIVTKRGVGCGGRGRHN